MVSLREVDPNDGSAPRRALVVAGMHRSGTSAMARTLSLLGASLPQHLMEAHADNPVGFWESEKVADFNDEILGTLDSEWDDVFSFRPRPYLSNFDRVFVGRAVELIDGEFNGAELIAFKDPRVSVLTAFWERALRQAGYSTSYIIMVRNPLEVADSLRTRNNFPRDKSLLLWSSYMTAVERDTRGLSRTFVSYDDLMRDWRKVLARVQDAAGVPFPRDTPAARNQIEAFLSRTHRHHETTADDLSSRGDVPDYVKTLYAVFHEASGGAPVDEQAIDAVQAELSKMEASVGSLVADLRDRARTLEKEVVETREAEQQAADRAKALSDELTAQQEQAADRAKALSDELTAQQEQAAELRAALEQEQAAARDARDALLNALNEKAISEGMLNQRIAALSEELRQRDAAVAAVEAKVAEQARQQAELNKRVSALSEDVRRKDASVREAREALEQSQAEKQAVDARLEDRFGELASLTRLLAEAEEREQQARAEADWLREAGAVLLDGSTRRKSGRWMALLPASLQEKRQRRMLKQMGLFDEEAYLASNPDVAAEGADPLGHYVKHGISEDRRRG